MSRFNQYMEAAFGDRHYDLGDDFKEIMSKTHWKCPKCENVDTFKDNPEGICKTSECRGKNVKLKKMKAVKFKKEEEDDE